MHFATPVLAVLAALGATVEAQRAVCSRKQYADVANSIQNPAYFCKFWLAEKRRGSVTPLKKYGVRSLTNLCKCFTQNSPRVRGPFKPLRPKAPPAGCPLSLYRPLRNQYKDPAQFCRWYNSVPRALSPLPAVPNPKAAVQACRCFLNKRFAPQQTTTTTTRRTTTTSRSTTTTTTTTTTDEPEVTSSTTSSGIFDGITASLTTTDFTLPTIFPTTTSADEETSTTTAAADETTTSSAAEDATTTTAEDASATDSTSSETATPTD